MLETHPTIVDPGSDGSLPEVSGLLTMPSTGDDPDAYVARQFTLGRLVGHLRTRLTERAEDFCGPPRREAVG